MTHPNREELADRLDLEASHVNGHGYCEAVLPVLLRSAAAALRKSPSVEEVSKWSAARNLFVRHAEAFHKATRYEEASAIADEAARDLDTLYKRGGG